jgi:hypothetical protein
VLSEEKEPKRISLEDAQKALKAAHKQRTETCWREIDAVLKKHSFALTARAFITDDGRTLARPVLVDPPKG